MTTMWLLWVGCSLSQRLDRAWADCGCVDGEVCVERAEGTDCPAVPEPCDGLSCADDTGACTEAMSALCDREGLGASCRQFDEDDVRRIVTCD